MRKNMLIFTLTIMFLFLVRVDAATGSINISCSSVTLKPGSETTCTLKGTSDSDVHEISTKIDVSDNLTISSIVLDSIWKADSTDFSDGLVEAYTASGDGIKNTFNIATIKIKAKNVVAKNETLSIKNTLFYNDNSKTGEISAENKSVSIRIPNNDAKLKTLSVGGVTLSPEFSADKTSYSATVEESEINLTATANDSKATVSGAGKKTLSYGNNKIDVVVTAEDGSKKTYTINVNRKDTRSKDNYLNKFEFVGYDIGFDKNKNNYNLVVENNVDTLYFFEYTVEELANRTIGTLRQDNILMVKVKIFESSNETADVDVLLNGNGIWENYENDFEIFEGLYDKSLNGDATQCNYDEKKCEISEGEYTLIDEFIEETDGMRKRATFFKNGMKILVSDVDSWFYYYIDKLKVGNNKLEIIVTAENGDERTYTFNINRKDKDGKITEDGKSSKEISKSPKTGNELFIIVAIILVLSLGTSIYFVKKKNKKDK